MMNNRDKAILNDLQRFRVMTRDQIAKLHFQGLKNPSNSANAVLKRLTRDKYIKANKLWSPYLYTLEENKIKKDSQKIPHFLEIVNCYMDIKSLREPKHLIVEPKYGKGNIEPDLFIMLGKQPLFIEIQRNLYTNKVMQDKIDRYEAYYHAGQWQHESWQPDDKMVFPSILILTPTRYPIQSQLRIYQAPSITEFLEKITKAPVVSDRPHSRPVQQSKHKLQNGKLNFAQ
ncbi:replication-relaxation family protein [Priestia endophytica]|uniref:replication-relaxation family protein n=1 Tax=Priestia endophytica TaxID=135735 RepID=UPI0027E12A87|nr:replication-relaxation family protein [Priestia endophytica]